MPFFTAFIWLVHPLQTQSVAYVVQRINSLAAMFYVLSMLFYVKFRLYKGNRGKWPLPAGCALAGLLAVGTKQIAATLPIFIFLHEWYFFPRIEPKADQTAFSGSEHYFVVLNHPCAHLFGL